MPRVIALVTKVLALVRIIGGVARIRLKQHAAKITVEQKFL